MKKALVLFLVAVIMMISSCATRSDTAELGGTVLYIARIDPAIHSHDAEVIARLEELGFAVTPVYSKDVTGAEAVDYDFIYMSESTRSDTLKAKFIATEKPILSCEMWIGDDMGFTGTEEGIDYGNLEYEYSAINIVKPDHPLAAGLSGEVEVYSRDGIMGFGKPGGDVTVVATAVDDPEVAFIYVYEKGAKNKLGDTVPGLRVWFYFFETMEWFATDDGWELWEAAVRYTFKK
jgi:hypothetical protein